MNQILIHREIDYYISLKCESRSVERTAELIGWNNDACKYFYSKADKTWLKWLREKGFLNVLINCRKEDSDISAYNFPEIDYLIRMAAEEPELVSEIINDVSIVDGGHNSELIYRLIGVINLLPPIYIAKLLKKIIREDWVHKVIWSEFSRFDFQTIVGALGSDYDGLLDLAKVVFAIKNNDHSKDKDDPFSTEDYFCLRHISDIGIFEAILDKNNNQKDKFLELLLGTLTQLSSPSVRKDHDVFERVDLYYFLDLDIFTQELPASNSYDYQADIKNLIVVVRKLIDMVFGEASNDRFRLKELYNKLFSYIPDSRTLWRLKLYIFSKYSKSFQSDIKDSLFRIFNVGERYFEIEGCAEYYHAIKESFPNLENSIRKEYIDKVFDYFGTSLEDRDKEQWRKRDGLKILSYVQDYMTKSEKMLSILNFGQFLDKDKLDPVNEIGRVEASFVSHKSPIKLSSYLAKEIINGLSSEWQPGVLKKLYNEDCKFEITDAEGLAEELRDDIKNRADDYFNNLKGFFDREKIHPHYVYYLLRGIDELSKEKKLNDNQYIEIFELFSLICASGYKNEFEKDNESHSLCGWTAVHDTMADIMLHSLIEVKGGVFDSQREAIVKIIEYLLSFRGSPDDQEEDSKYGDLFHIAINSVRGRAFQAFIQLICNDGDALKGDIKLILQKIIKEDKALSIHFLIGHYLSFCYFRDKDFIRNLLPLIFPKDNSEKINYFFAAWEGYLINNLYKELFVELKIYYDFAINVNIDNYPKRKYAKDIDEALAGHIALAYIYFELAIDDVMFKNFWLSKNTKRHHEFIAFIGRSCVSREQASDDWLSSQKIDKEKLISFWNWALSESDKIDPEVYAGFGFWINPEKEIISNDLLIKNVKLSLEKSDGNIDWDYGLIKRLVKFAEIGPSDTLSIIRSYLLSRDGNLNKFRTSPLFCIDKEIKDALEVIYKNDDCRERTETLIGELIVKGSQVFWGLKEVIRD